MALLIDGLNLIYKIPESEGFMYDNRLREARASLLEILASYNRLKKEKIIVFFDGKKNPSDRTKNENFGNIEIFYSHDYSADFFIKEYILKSNNPRMLTVVTSDNEIIINARRLRAKTITSENFAEMIKKTILDFTTSREEEKNPNPVLSDDEILLWEKVFSKKKR